MALPPGLSISTLQAAANAARRSPGQTLLMDADDTLWENNIYFERAIASFLSLLDHEVHTPAEVRATLNRCEHETIREHGYGVGSFEKSLLRCFRMLYQGKVTDRHEEQIRGFAQAVAEQEIELLAGVAETLPGLAARHTVILVTKGNAVEQRRKLERSGIHEHFSSVEIPPEKTPQAYADLVERYDLDRASTWMIGNSPRSDINPALATGMHAVYVHHPHTWVLERDEVNAPKPPQELLLLDNFAQLDLLF